jgi:hypothetical protein
MKTVIFFMQHDVLGERKDVISERFDVFPDVLHHFPERSVGFEYGAHRRVG